MFSLWKIIIFICVLLRFVCCRKNKGNCENQTTFKLKKQRFLPHYLSDKGRESWRFTKNDTYGSTNSWNLKSISVGLICLISPLQIPWSRLVQMYVKCLYNSQYTSNSKYRIQNTEYKYNITYCRWFCLEGRNNEARGAEGVNEVENPEARETTAA